MGLTRGQFKTRCVQFVALYASILADALGQGITLKGANGVLSFAKLLATPAAVQRKPLKKAAKKAAKKASVNTSNAAVGRRAVARGDRPPMKEAMATVMGNKAMTAGNVIEGLKKRGWMPNAEDPQQYMSYMLSSNRNVFERLERGVYKVRKAARPVTNGKAHRKPAPKVSVTDPQQAEDQQTAVLKVLTKDFVRAEVVAKATGVKHVRPTLDALVAKKTVLTRVKSKRREWALPLSN